MFNKKRSIALESDIYLLTLIFILAAMGMVTMVTTESFFMINTIYIGISAFLVLMTYFFDLVVGLSLGLLFTFGQVLVLIRMTIDNVDIPWNLLFWLFAPILLIVAFSGVIRDLLKLQEENKNLHELMIENGAYDQQTNLRTTVSFLEDAGVFISTGQRFDIPVTVMTIRIRYFKDLQTMLGEHRIKELISFSSEIINEYIRDNDIAYILATDNPTWAVLFYTDNEGAEIAADRIRSNFDREIKENRSFTGIDIGLKIGIHMWTKEDAEGPNEFMREGIRELEYDV